LFFKDRKHMNWDLAIKRNSEVLAGIVETLFAMLGIDGTETVGRIPHRLHRAVLRVLRPAESAVRRLIVVASRGLVVKVAPTRPMPKGHRIAKGSGPSTPAFKLCDKRIFFPELDTPRVRYAKHPPRILFLGPDSKIDDLWPRPPPAPPPAPPDGLVTAARLTRRLQALKSALDDLPRQARRMARWRARREAEKAPKFKSPLRPGQPPGHRRKPTHEVDEILANCHWLAWEVMRLKPDTS
jgi:hypothetical protein